MSPITHIVSVLTPWDKLDYILWEWWESGKPICDDIRTDLYGKCMPS